MSFYDELLLELLAALGAALFAGNLVALVRRRRDRQAATMRPGQKDAKADLPQAPVARTLLYMALGFAVMVWAVGSLLA